ncbi:MAG: outer membrane lipoprotein-sorting protein, partial [Pseudomonadota bacterium]
MKTTLLNLLGVSTLFLMPSVAQTSHPTGREIAEKMDQIDSSEDGTRDATMVIQRGNQQLVRKLAILNKKFGDDERSLIRFLEPADVRDTQYLSWTYEDPLQDDDMWVFFPSDNLIRRISGGGKKGSFMRSDFANEDIESRAVDDDTHNFVEVSELGQRQVYVIDSMPIAAKAKDSNYHRRRSWVDAEYWIALQVEFYDARDRLIKKLSQGDIQHIDGIWTATKLVMETPRRKSRTLMQYNNVRFNVGHSSARFE